MALKDWKDYNRLRDSSQANLKQHLALTSAEQADNKFSEAVLSSAFAFLEVAGVLTRGFSLTTNASKIEIKSIKHITRQEGGELFNLVQGVRKLLLFTKGIDQGSDMLNGLIVTSVGFKNIMRIKREVQDPELRRRLIAYELMAMIAAGTMTAINIKGMRGNKTRGYVYTTKADMYRKSKNIGVFADLSEPMQLKHVKKVAKDAGIGYDGVKIKIVRNPDLINSGYCGYTYPKGNMIELYPDAFKSREILTKTLGHERIHVFQRQIYGKNISSSQLKNFEKAAYGSENMWWNYYNLGK